MSTDESDHDPAETDNYVSTEDPVRFSDQDDRDDAMHATVERWTKEIASAAADARESETFERWLDAQAAFHDYSDRNSMLIRAQCPEATRVAGYRTWQDEFDRQVQEGESAIWIWAPIITTRCPECENSPSYHADSDCDYDETDPEEWDEGLVGFRPAPVFDVSQTEGEPLPELETAAHGEADALFDAALGAADSLEVDVTVFPERDWSHGDAKGVCRTGPSTDQPRIDVLERDNTAAMASTLVHEYAHAELHHDATDDTEQSRRELEAEAVAAVVGRHFGLDTSNARFYLAAWSDDPAATIRERLARISRTATELIEIVEV